jgi:hypothetical protein
MGNFSDVMNVNFLSGLGVLLFNCYTVGEEYMENLCIKRYSLLCCVPWTVLQSSLLNGNVSKYCLINFLARLDVFFLFHSV